MASTDPLTDVVRAVRDALDGGPAYAPQPRLSDAVPPPGTALVLRTSGSTGDPREVALSAAALRASARATHERLGGSGSWLLVLPPTHVAGVQVITRSLVTGRGVYPHTLDRFTPAGFAAVATDFADLLAHGPRAYVSLVPTQLHRLVTAAEGGDAAGLDALTRFDAVLVGGAATPAPLLAAARAAGVRVVTTYGMSETSGGCVYDGVPLAGVRVRAAGAEPEAGRGPTPGSGGVVELSGPMLAEGYVGAPSATAAAFRTDPDGVRWFRTSDLGRLDDGRLTILGRADDVILTGGVNVAPAAVEDAIAEHLAGLGSPGEACVVGVPDPEWGQAVVAVVAVGRAPSGRVPAGGPGLTDSGGELLAGLRSAVGQRLGSPAAPRRVYVTAALPTRGPGKVDRRAVRDAVVRAERMAGREPVRP
ncbi:O-succinylbenzoic acid--CoA ligase [Promicromonospora umidemergens]|uniref:O-succinylbenzoate--CoA ligase n=1 Tax=Promicromonospora umidemergens TaxID=629679 RepID=A0ABP8WZD5_9MICO|nr:AMP-binding protein [Promicromonospora umidemergens]MCP2286137.1 O-succinylbenzoic acid--CoA ligase [Promicromonospora umidemergens]